MNDDKHGGAADRPEEEPVAAERHPGPWIGPDAELARACAMVAIADYGDDDPVTHQRIMKDGVWNDHVAVQAALATIHTLRKRAAHPRPAEQAEPLRERVAETIGWYLACVVAGNNQPDMSGDPRKRIAAGKRRHFEDACRACADAILAVLSQPAQSRIAFRIEYNGFVGEQIGSYLTREGKRGVVLQQIGTRIVHVYGEKWLKPVQSGEGHE